MMTWRDLIRRGHGLRPGQLDQPVLFLESPDGPTVHSIGSVLTARDNAVVTDKASGAKMSIRKGERFLST